MWRRATVILYVVFFASAARAWTFTAAGGQTVGAANSEHNAYRAEANFPWITEVWRRGHWTLSLNHALSVATFRDANTVNAISWAPNLVLATSGRSDAIRPFLQASFGFAYLSDDRFQSEGYELWDGNETSEMGSRGQFESNLAVGLIKGRFSIRLKGYHYSNAEFSSANGGMNVAELGIGYSL